MITKLFIALLLLLSASPRALAKEIPEPTKMARFCEDYNPVYEYICITGDCCKMNYIYKFPKNVDKMLQENPEFSDEIFNLQDDWDNASHILKVNCQRNPPGDGKNYYYSGKSCYKKDKKIQEININNCYNLWTYDPYFVTLFEAIDRERMEFNCNKILEKIVRKTGKLY